MVDLAHPRQLQHVSLFHTPQRTALPEMLYKGHAKLAPSFFTHE